MPLNFTVPAVNTTFTISADPTWPAMVFRTDGTGAHTWQWTVTWGTFSRTGTATTAGNEWDAQSALTNLGGTLDVVATAPASGSASIRVLIRGTNPSPTDVTNYLTTRAGGSGFERIIRRESRFQHFNGSGEPVRSFDNGYGMCQLTTPVPSFEQVWNWKSNVSGGLALFAQKYAAAVAYLRTHGTYTAAQADLEAISRWNGGRYHVWDTATNAWVRNPNILCDSTAGNIGWDMSDPVNAGQTEAQLHTRDAASYRRGPRAGAHWDYYGVCYADHH
jgi:hypothetical protein